MTSLLFMLFSVLFCTF